MRGAIHSLWEMRPGAALGCVVLVAVAGAGCFLDRGGLVGDGGCLGHPELCDGVDNDCDPTTADGDGDPIVGASCDSLDDADGCTDDAFVCASGRLACVDDGVSIPEVCGGGDEDCDGVVDEGGSDFFLDGDGDGYGGGPPVSGCVAPPMHVVAGGDCDDANASINPAGAENCDGVDQNCDGRPDDEVCGCPSIAVEGHAYLLCAGPAFWSEAEARCRAVGYVLATPEDAPQSTALGAVLPAGATFWLGLLNTANVWRWLDGSEAAAALWAAGEGAGTAGEGCGALAMSGEWIDRQCGEGLPFVCER